MRNEEVFRKLLEFGAEKGLDGFSRTALHEWAKEHGFLKNDKDISPLENLVMECCKISHEGKDTWYYLQSEYYFRLIEYQELQEARKAAREANRNAFIAIGISIFAIIISAVLTFAQLRIPTSLTKSDLNVLISSNNKSGVEREVKLDSLQMTQILSAIGYDKSNTNAKKKDATNQGHEASHFELINQYFENQ